MMTMKTPCSPNASDVDTGELVSTPPLRGSFGRLSPALFLHLRRGMQDNSETSGTADDTEDDEEIVVGDCSVEETCFEGEFCLQLTPVGAVVKCRVQQASNEVQKELRMQVTGNSSLEDAASGGEVRQIVDSPRSLKLKQQKRQKRSETKRGAARRKQRKRRSRHKRDKKKMHQQQGHAFCLQLTPEGEVAICEPMHEANQHYDENTEITDPSCFASTQSVMSAHYALVNQRKKRQEKNRLTRGYCLQLTPQGQVVKCRSTLTSREATTDPHYNKDIVKRLEKELEEHHHLSTSSSTDTEAAPQHSEITDEEFCLQLTPVGDVVKRRALWEQEGDALPRSDKDVTKEKDEGGDKALTTPKRSVKGPSHASPFRLSSIHEKLNSVMKTPEKKSYDKSSTIPSTPEKRRPNNVFSTPSSKVAPNAEKQRPLSASPRKARRAGAQPPRTRPASMSPQKTRLANKGSGRVPQPLSKTTPILSTPPETRPLHVPSTPQKTRPVNVVTPLSEGRRPVKSLPDNNKIVPAIALKPRQSNPTTLPLKIKPPSTPRKTRPAKVNVSTPERMEPDNVLSTPKGHVDVPATPQKSKPVAVTPERSKPVTVTPPTTEMDGVLTPPSNKLAPDASFDDDVGFESGDTTELLDSSFDSDNSSDDMYMQLTPDGHVICCLSDSPDSRRLHPVFSVSPSPPPPTPTTTKTVEPETIQQHRKPPLVQRLFGVKRSSETNMGVC